MSDEIAKRLSLMFDFLTALGFREFFVFSKQNFPKELVYST